MGAVSLALRPAPRLHVYFDPAQTYMIRTVTDAGGVPGYFCHVMVRNDGHDVARKCRGRLMAVLQRDADGRTAQPQASSLPWFSNGLTNWTGTGTLGILSTMFLVGWTSAMRFSQPRNSCDSSATRCLPGCRQYSRQGSTPSVSEWMPRTPPTSRAPSTSTSPMGGARSRSRWPERSRSGACCPGLTRHPADEHRPSSRSPARRPRRY